MNYDEAWSIFEDEKDYWWEKAYEWGDYHYDQTDELFEQAFDMFLDERGIEIDD